MSKLTGGKMLAQLNRKNPNLGALISKLIAAHNHIAAQIGVDPVGQAAAPPPPQGVDVIVTGEQTNIRVVDNNPTNRARTYFSEVHTDAQFTSPKMVVQHGATRDAQVALPTFDATGVMQAYHIRTYSQTPGSPPSPPVAYPTYVTMAGTTSGDLPASAGSGTSPATGTVSAQGYGAFPTRAATKSNTAVYTGGGGGGGGVGGVTQIVAGSNITISPAGGTGIVTVNSTASGMTQLTGDVTAGPGSGSQAATVVATHLAAPLPVAQGGSGTTTPSLVGGTNVTITGSWPNQTVTASGGGGSVSFGTGNPNGSSAVHVQSRASGASTIAFTDNVAAEDLLIVALHTQGSLSAIGVHDSLGTEFTQVFAQDAPAGTNTINIAIYAGYAAASGMDTVTATGLSGWNQIIISEFSGVTSEVDVSGGSYATGTPAAIPLTTTAPDLIYVYLASWGSGISYTAGAGFILAAQNTVNPCDAAEYRFTPDAGLFSATFVPSGGGDQAMAAVAFKLIVSPPLPGSDGDIYFDTFFAKYSGYVYHSGAWNAF